MRRPDARAMAQLLAEQTQTAAGLILRLAWRQGLTREEIQRLTWNDVDFSAHQLRLPDRTIPLETETEDCLRRQAERPDPPTRTGHELHPRAFAMGRQTGLQFGDEDDGRRAAE